MNSQLSLDPDQFTTQINMDLCCSFCFGVLRNTRQCPNGHMYCLRCIIQSLERESSCPVCRIFLTPELLSVNRFADNFIAELEIRCQNSSCDWRGPCRDLNQHFDICGFSLTKCLNHDSGCPIVIERMHVSEHTEVCEYQPVPCRYCQLSFQRRDLDHEVICEMKPFSCPNGCEAMCTLRDQGTHNLTCPDYLVPCTFAVHGCTEVAIRRKDLPQHHSDSAVHHCELVGRKLVCLESRYNSMFSNINTAQVNVEWKAQILPDDAWSWSQPVTVSLAGHGEYILQLIITGEINGYRSLLIRSEGGLTYPLFIGGSTLSVRGKTYTMDTTDSISRSEGKMGWENAVRVSSLRKHLINDRLVIKGVLKISVAPRVVEL
jgi:hypothetical protein